MLSFIKKNVEIARETDEFYCKFITSRLIAPSERNISCVDIDERRCEFIQLKNDKKKWCELNFPTTVASLQEMNAISY